MRHITATFIALGMLIGGAAGVAHGQAWTQSEGHTYLKVAYGAATASEQYAFDGQLKLYADDVYAPAFFDRSVYLYGEVGLTDRLTLVAAMPYKRVIVRDLGFRYETAALGDLELGARWSLLPWLAWLPESAAAAVNVRATLPTFYTRNLLPAPGRGQVDLAATVDYGQGFGLGFLGAAYAQVGAGYRMHTPWYGLSNAAACQPGQDRGCTVDQQSDPGDEIVARAELGARPWSPLLLQGLSEAVVSLRAPSVGFSASEPAPTSQRYLKVGVGVEVTPLPHIALSAQAFATPWGRNTVRSVDLFVGLSTDFSLWER